MATTSKDKTFYLRQMSSLCVDHSSLKARVAQTSVFDSFGKTTYEKFLLTFEYLQLLSPILLTIVFLDKDRDSWLFSTVLFIARMINPAYWIAMSTLSDLKIFIMVVLFTILAGKMLLPGWIAYKLYKNSAISPILLKIWRNIFKSYGRAIYYYVTSLLVNGVMKARLDTGESETSRNKVMLAIFIFFTASDFILTLVFTSRYLYLLPSKNFLSTKDNITEVITLCQKFMIQMLIVFVDLDSLGGFWAFTIVNLLADIIRDLYFFKTLPLYSFKALAYQGRLLMGVTSINIACFVCAIAKSIDENVAGLQWVIVIWILLGIFSLKLSEDFIEKSFWVVISNPKVKDPYLLVHRIIAIKQLRKLTSNSSSQNAKCDWTFLLSKTLNENLRADLKLDASFTGTGNFDINCKDSSTLMFKYYLEKLAESHPENHLIQLIMAQFNMKKFKKYSDAIRITKNIVKKGSSRMSLNAELLLIEIQSLIYRKSSAENPENQFDALSYIQQQSMLAQIKLHMLEQAKLQIRVCEEMKKDSPNLALISDNSQVLNNFKVKIGRRMRAFLQAISEYNIEPLLLYSQYHLVLNHSFGEYLKYIDQFIQKNQKCQKHFTKENFTQKSMFQNNVGFYFISANKTDSGNIVFTSRTGLSGVKDTNMHSGTNLAERAPPILRPIYAAFYKSLTEGIPDTYLNKVIRAFSYLREEDCLIELDYNLSIHPFATQGFYLNMIFRQVETTRGSMYVHENGDIEAATKNIKKKLGMNRRRPENSKPIYNIKDLSEELVLANQAFNQIALPQKYTKMSKEEIDEIYSTYAKSGKDLLLKSFRGDFETMYSYNCKIENKPFGPLLLKVFTFEENIKENRTKAKNTPLDTIEPTQPSYECLGADEIHFETLNSPKTFMTTRKETAIVDTMRDEETPSHRFLLDSPHPLLSKGDEKFPIPSQRRRFKSQHSTTNFAGESRSNTQGKENKVVTEKEDEGEKSFILTMNNSSTYSARKKRTAIYKTALNAKYYPKLFKVAAGLFILMLIGFAIGEVIFLRTIDTNTEELKVKKDILRNFQLRSYLSVCIEGFVRIMWELMTGSLTLADMTNFPPSYAIYFLMTSELLNQLVEANGNLQVDANSLNDDLKELLFNQNIPIYSTYFDQFPQEYENLNTFQAIDRILETGFSILKNNFAQTPEIRQKSLFFFRNTLNDLITKNQIISDKLQETLDSQRHLIEHNITGYLIAKSLILGIVLLSALLLLWRIYIKEEFNLSAFCRINGNKLDFALRGFREFKESIEDHTTFTHDFRFLLKKNDEDRKNPAGKKEFLKVSNSQGIQKKYFISAAKYFVMISIFTGLMVASSKIAGKNMSDFNTKQDQIYLMDLMRTKTTLVVAASRELLVTNNTAYIENTIIADSYASLIDQFSQMRLDMYDMFIDTGVADRSQRLHDFLLGDSCPYYDSALAPLQCTFLAKKGYKRDFINVLTSLENILRDQLTSYLNSNKSEEVLDELKTETISVTLAEFMLLINIQEEVARIIDNELNAQIEDSHDDRVAVFIGWMVMIVVIGILAWWMILGRIMDGVNNFKNVLKVLPGDVICSSFILKTFLIKTTHKGLGVDLNKI